MKLQLRLSASYYIDHLPGHPSTIHVATYWVETMEISDRLSLHIPRERMATSHDIGEPISVSEQWVQEVANDE